MLPLDAVGRSNSYSLDALRALPAAILDGLCFDNFPERHGFAALNVWYKVNSGEVNYHQF